ncbi:MAG: S9 family peptidase [Cytophagaceae bacterium]|nr:S9 family peptidase [Cytophagaceae bacterium]
MKNPALFLLPVLLAGQLTGSTVALGQTVVKPTDNLVVEGLPPIPTSVAEGVKRYTESRSAFFTSWHPTKQEMLIGTRFANTPQVHRLTMPMGARTQLTFFDEPVNGGSYDPKAGAYFLFGKDVGGNEFAQLYRYDLADGTVTLLTDGGRSQNDGPTWSPSGSRIAYGSTRRNGGDRDVYVMNPLDPKSDRLVLQVQGGGWGAIDWSPDEKQVLVSEYLSVNESHLYLVDVASGQKTELTPRSETGVAYGGGVFSKDGKGIFLTTDKDSEFQRLAYLDLATKKWSFLTDAIRWDVEQVELSKDGKRLAFTTNEAGVTKLHLMDPKTRQYKPVPGLPVGNIGGLNWHPDNSGRLALTMATARSTADVFVLNANTNALTRWTESELGGIVPSSVSEPKLITWKSFDGKEISGFYYKPGAKFRGKRPVIINIHGGPEGQSSPSFLGRSNYVLNELGVAMIFPNVRGSTGYGKSFVKLDNGLKRKDSVKDIGALLDWIAQQPDLDASRVMVTGGSYGGYMTLACAVDYNDRIRCALDVVGISDFKTFLQNTESYRRDLRRAEYGDEREPEMATFFEQIAPLNNAAKITKPLFVVQGGNDPRVPRTEALQMANAVRKNGSPVWYLEAKDEGHGFRKKGNQDFLFYTTVQFIKQFLLNEAP